MEPLLELDDLALAAAAAEGDESAFAEIFDRHYDMVHALAYRFCLERGLAEEIAQETFVKAAGALRAFQGSSLKGWLYRIGANAARDALRRRRREGETVQNWKDQASLHGAERRPDFSRVEMALAALPEEWRAAVALVYFEDLSHAEAAFVLGCAETTISWRLFRARRQLKSLLA